MKRLLCVLGLAAVLGGCGEPTLLERVERGGAEAQYELGQLRDLAGFTTEGVKWYRKAAEQGYARAQNNLGNLYYNGEGVAKDEVEAVKWFRKAAEQGHADAKERLKKLGIE